MLRFVRDSIRVKILAPVAAILVLLFVTLSAYSTWFASDEARFNLETKAKGESRLAAYALSKPLAYKDLEQIEPVLDGIASDPDVSAVALYGPDGAFIAGNRWDKSRVSLDELLKEPFREGSGHMIVTNEIIDRDRDEATARETVARVGALWIDFSSERMAKRVSESRLRYILFAGIGVVLTTLLLAWVLTRLFAPIHDLTRVAGEIVRGDLTQKVRVRSTDEIGQLASAFGQMLTKLREIPLRLQETTQLLTESVDSLSVSTTEHGKTVTRQAAAVQETQVTVQEIKQTSQLAAQKAESVIEVAKRADAIGRSGEVAISQSLGGLSDIGSQVEQIAHRIGELHERTLQIGRITETVKELADKSNMLALNAAIEAVRSGEHGRGFAVVAREIRSLADQSIQATHRVREILDGLGDAIRSAVSITEKGAQKIEGSIVQITVSGESLRELSSIVKDNASAVRQIAAAVSQQDAGIIQIFGAVSDLNQMMDETISRLEHTGESVDALRGVSARVATVVASFRV